MPIAFISLPQLNDTALVAAIEPILEKHQVAGVELIWKTDQGGAVLELTIEVPGTRMPGEGITVDVCSAVSREISAFLDESNLIASDKYRLDVGSPGVERALYRLEDYERFSGQTAKLKLDHLHLSELAGGQRTLRGVLGGLRQSESGDTLIVLQKKKGEILIDPKTIEKAQLVFTWGSSQKNSPSKKWQ